jgi:hypothetical protein
MTRHTQTINIPNINVTHNLCIKHIIHVIPTKCTEYE